MAVIDGGTCKRLFPKSTCAAEFDIDQSMTREKTNISVEPSMNKVDAIQFDEQACGTISRNHSFIRFKWRSAARAVQFFAYKKSGSFTIL